MRSEPRGAKAIAMDARRWRLMSMGLLLSAGATAACMSSHEEPNSNTNWLRSCTGDKSCGPGAQCVCGTCHARV